MRDLKTCTIEILLSFVLSLTNRYLSVNDVTKPAHSHVMTPFTIAPLAVEQKSFAKNVRAIKY